MRVRLAAPATRPLERLAALAPGSRLERRRDSSSPARRRCARRCSTPCAPRASTIRGLTAEEGRLDALYRELVGEPDEGRCVGVRRWRSLAAACGGGPPGAGAARHAQRRLRRVPDDRVERALRRADRRARRGAAVLRRPRLPARLPRRTRQPAARGGRLRRRPPDRASGCPPPTAVFTQVPGLETPMGSHLVAHADAASRDGDPAARGRHGGGRRSASSAGRLPGRAAMTAVSHVRARPALRPPGAGPRRPLALDADLRRRLRRRWRSPWPSRATSSPAAAACRTSRAPPRRWCSSSCCWCRSPRSSSACWRSPPTAAPPNCSSRSRCRARTILLGKLLGPLRGAGRRPGDRLRRRRPRHLLAGRRRGRRRLPRGGRRGVRADGRLPGPRRAHRGRQHRQAALARARARAGGLVRARRAVRPGRARRARRCCAPAPPRGC